MATITEHQDLTGSLTLTGDTYTCSAGDGGAFWVKGGGALDGYAIFSGNVTTSTGGDGGAIFNQGTITLSNTLFENNSASVGIAPNGRGGAICNAGNATVSLTNTTFTNNSARIGGAIYNSGTLNLENVDFTTASDTIYNDGSLVTRGVINASGTSLTTTRSFDNYAILTLGEMNASNSSLAAGGVMWNGGTVTLASGTLSGNVATMGGGAFWNHSSTSVLDIGAVLFANNAADNSGTYVNGGAIYNQQGATAYFNGSTFSGNSAANGGAIYNTDSTATVTDAVFDNNSVVASPNYDGGAIYSVRSTLTVSGGTFSANSAGGRGGAVCVDQGTLSLSGTEFYANTADQGGALANNGTATVSSLYFSGNSAASAGGAIYNTGSLDLTGATFATASDTFYNTGTMALRGEIDASATTFTTKKTFDNYGNLTIGTFNAIDINGTGGAGAVWNGGTLTLLGGTIANTSYSDAGAIRNHYSDSVANIGAVLFSENTAGNDGGALYNNGTMNISGATFSGNQASRGGAVYNVGTTNIDGAIFATATDTIFNYGTMALTGEIDASATTFTTKKTFDNYGNLTIGTFDAVGITGTGGAGAIWNGGTVTLLAGTVANTSYSDAGAVKNHYSTSVANVGAVLFAGNIAGNEGGAIYNNGTVNIDGATFSGNQATNRGGALTNNGTANIANAIFATASDTIFNYGTINFVGGTVDASATAITSHSRISNDGSILVVGDFNSSGATTVGGGGGFYNGATTTINGGTFSGNYAALGGSAIYNKAGETLTLNNMLFSDNAAPAGAYGGGAIYADEDGTLTVSGSTFSGNSITGDGGAIFNYGYAVISDTLFSGNTATKKANGKGGSGGAILGFSGENIVSLSGVTFATASDTIVSAGTVTFTDSNVINASIGGGGTFLVNGADLVFANAEEITVAALTLEGDQNSIAVNGEAVNFRGFVFSSGSQADFNGANIAKALLAVDASAYTGGEVTIATNVSKIGGYAFTDTDNSSLFLKLDGTTVKMYERAADIADGATLSGYTGTNSNLMTGGSISGAFFGTAAASGSVRSVITGGEIDNAFVGGAKVASGSRAALDSVMLEVFGGEIKGGNANGGQLYAAGYAYGADPNATDAEITLAVGSSILTLKGGSFAAQNLFAGAHARKGAWTSVAETVITMTGGTFKRIYGGGWAEKYGKSEVGTATISVSGGRVEYIYAGGANAAYGTTITGSATISVSGSASVDFVFLGGKNANCFVGGTQNDEVVSALTVSGAAKTMTRISGWNACGKDRTTGLAELNVQTDLEVSWLDHVDRINLAEGNKLTVATVDYVRMDEALVNFALDGELDASWEVLSGEACDAFSDATFAVNGITAAWNKSTGQLGDTAYALTYNESEKKFTFGNYIA